MELSGGELEMKRVKIGLQTAKLLLDYYYEFGGYRSLSAKHDKAFDRLHLAIYNVEHITEKQLDKIFKQKENLK